MKAAAAVRIHRARSARRTAGRLAHERSASTRHAIPATAAVRIGRAGTARIDASSDAVASRDTELVKLARSRVAGCAAAVVARGGDRASV